MNVSKLISNRLGRAYSKQYFVPSDLDTKAAADILANAGDASDLGFPVDIKLPHHNSKMFDDPVAITAISFDNITAFNKTGEWKSMYERGRTWHDKFSSPVMSPEASREFNDLRLFGDRAEDVTYAALMPRGTATAEGRTQLPNILRHLMQYGDGTKDGTLFIRWRLQSSLDRSTFTLGDSQHNFMVHRFSKPALMGLIFTSIALDAQHPLEQVAFYASKPKGLTTLYGCRWRDHAGPYVELQMHGGTGYDDVEEVLTYDELHRMLLTSSDKEATR